MLRLRSLSLPTLAFVGLVIALFTYGVLALELHLHHGFMMDDAYISLRYAHNFADGKGLVYNPGERVEGYTNFLMTMIMSVPFFLGCDPIIFAKAFGWLTCVSLILSTGVLTRRLAGPLACVVIMLFMALDQHLAWWSGSGLETMLVSALYVPALLLLDRRRLGWAAVLYALAALTRMETVLLFVTAFVFVFWRSGFRVRRPRQTLRALWPVVRFGLIFTAIFGVYFVWRFAYYGWLFPNTYYAKVGTVQAAWQRGVDYLDQWLTDLHLLTSIYVAGGAVVIVVVLSIVRRFVRAVPAAGPRSGLGWLVTASAIVYALYVVSVGGDHFRERFVYHFYPLLLGALAWACRALVDVTAVASRWRRGAPLVVGLLLAALLPNAVGTPSLFHEEAGLGAWAAVGIYEREHAKGRPLLVATDAAGIMPYESGLPTVDILGLCDEHIAHLPVEIGHGVAGHEKADPLYVLNRNPDYLSTWIDGDGHVGRGFRRFYRFWRDYELVGTARTDERYDVAHDRIRNITPGTTPAELATTWRVRDGSGNYDWGIWARRTGPVPRRWYGRFDFGTSIPGANEHEDALIEVPAGHPPGHIMFGPGTELPAGHYHIAFELEVGTPTKPVADDEELCHFDIWDGTVLFERGLPAGEWADHIGTIETDLDVTPERAFRPTEMRLSCTGDAPVIVRRGWLEE